MDIQMPDKIYTAEAVGKMLNRTAQTIRFHGRKYNIGIVLDNGYRVYTDENIQELKNHVGNYGNPKRGGIYKEWELDQFKEFVRHNGRKYEGYDFTEEQLSKMLDTTPAAIRGLRRRYKLARRILLTEKREATTDEIARLMSEYSESDLRKWGRKYPTIEEREGYYHKYEKADPSDQ